MSDKGLTRYLKALQKEDYLLVDLLPVSADTFVMPGKVGGVTLTLCLLTPLFCSLKTFATSMFFAFIFDSVY